MVCDMCGHQEVVLKTCRCRDREGSGTLCDSCWLPRRHLVWVIPGPVACFGTCRSCSEWFSLRELADMRTGGRRDAPTGVCGGCVE
jgi:hypothetical protein